MYTFLLVPTQVPIAIVLGSFTFHIFVPFTLPLIIPLTYPYFGPALYISHSYPETIF